MTLTVLQVGYPLAPVGQDTAGGAEQVIAMLDRALVRAGHESLVIASEGSDVTGTLIPIPRTNGVLDDAARMAAWGDMCRAMDHALKHWKVDVVHMHGLDYMQYLPPPDVRTLVTLHLPISWYPPTMWKLDRPNTLFHCVSQSQQRTCPPEGRLLPAIPNGVSVDEFRSKVSRRSWAIALGRICPEKGFHLALEAARHAGIPLLIAGQLYRYPEHERYLNSQVLPRLGPCYRFIGPVNMVRKRRLLSAARCLLVPSLAPETSSLVAMESMACGTPVIAFPNGALAEIVENGMTGFLVSNTLEMAEAIHRTGEIDPEVCRETARERFSADKMIARYLQTYSDLTLVSDPGIPRAVTAV